MPESQGHYELEESHAPPTPKLPGTVMMRRDQDATHDVILAEIMLHAGNCIRAFGDFQFAIAFEPEVERLVRRMMTDPLYREFPWTRTRAWLAEELRVPPSDPRRRGDMLWGLLVEGSGMPPQQAHAIAIDEPDAVARAERALREHLGWREKGHDRMDLLLTTVHADGTLAGIHDDARDGAALMASGVRDGVELVSMTGAMAGATRCVCVVATGAHAASGVRRCVDRGLAWSRAVDPAACEVRWYLDHAAAGVAVE